MMSQVHKSGLTLIPRQDSNPTMITMLRRRGATTLLAATSYLSQTNNQVEISLQGTPLLGHQDEESQLPNDDDDEPSGSFDPSGRRLRFSIWTGIVLVLASLTLVVNVLALVGLGFLLSSVVGAGVAIAVGVTQLKMEDLESLREVHNRVRRSVNQMARQNIRLTKSVTELKKRVTALQGSEQALNEIAQKQQSSVNQVLDVIKENERILNETRRIVKEDLMAELMDTIMKGESDESGSFSDVEIQRLLRYMRGLPAVRVNEELLTKAIQDDRSIFSLLNIIRDIAREGDQLGDRIFVIDHNDAELQARFIEE
eukprot:Nitzschia sp. Nitz4//scaffold147_size54853//1198//2246//NITZ4_006606-RA/size54853-augustus-gene-0.3-mRNA-1//-1//CDS//3329536660//4803//frame0